MRDWFKSLSDPEFRRRRRIAAAVTGYMAAHCTGMLQRIYAWHFTEEVMAKRAQAELSFPNVKVGFYADFATLVMLTALEEGGSAEDDVEDSVGRAQRMLETVFRLDAGRAFNAVGSCILRMPQVDRPEGVTFVEELDGVDEDTLRQLKLCSLAEGVGGRIAAGVARGERAFEPTPDEIERVAALLDIWVGQAEG